MDKISQCEKNHGIEYTDFVDPALFEIGVDLLKKYCDSKWFAIGGASGAERKKFVIYPPYLDETKISAEVNLVQAKGRFVDKKFSHRDFLGALLGLGIQRGKIGDIWLHENGAVIVIDKSIYSFLQVNSFQIKGVDLVLEELNPATWQPPGEKGKLITTTVASLRLDVIAAAGFGTSRSKIVPEIKGGRFKINWREIKDVSFICRHGDTISARGRGRLKILEITGETKKGRIKVMLERLA